MGAQESLEILREPEEEMKSQHTGNVEAKLLREVTNETRAI